MNLLMKIIFIYCAVYIFSSVNDLYLKYYEREIKKIETANQYNRDNVAKQTSDLRKRFKEHDNRFLFYQKSKMYLIFLFIFTAIGLYFLSN